MKRLFKKGDVVQLIENRQMNAPIGAIAIVKGYTCSSMTWYLNVKWKAFFREQEDGGYNESSFQLLHRPNTTK